MALSWMLFTYVFFVISCLVFLVLTVVITIGGIFDIKYLIKSLREVDFDETDDGRVNPN